MFKRASLLLVPSSSAATRSLQLVSRRVVVVVGSGGGDGGGGARTYISRGRGADASVSACFCSRTALLRVVWCINSEHRPCSKGLLGAVGTGARALAAAAGPLARVLLNQRTRSFHLSANMPNIINDIKLDFKDVLLRPKRSTLKSRSDVDLFREITFLNSKQTYRGIPVMASNMDTVGTFEMARVLSKHGLFTTVHKYYTPEQWREFATNNPDCVKNMAASSGTGNDDFERLSNVLAAIPELSFICIDVANGYSQHFVEYVRKVRAQFPTHTIIAGNVVTGEMVEELILSGADIIKVGIGPGSVCTTRMKTGVGYPQLSAVIECADAAHGLKGHIISDGGCICPGDIAKAFGAGADFVMAGGMFAGHDECGGDMIEKNGKKFKLFYGMASNTAMKKHAGGVADYRSSEGKTVEVLYKGPVDATVLDILGGLRSACTYVGASRLRELPKRATFIRCTQQLNNIFGSPF